MTRPPPPPTSIPSDGTPPPPPPEDGAEAIERFFDRLNDWLDKPIRLRYLPLVAATSLLLDGAVVVALWRWFLVPAGLPPITLRVAIGADLVINLLHRGASAQRTVAGFIASTLVVPMLTLAAGALAARFLP